MQKLNVLSYANAFVDVLEPDEILHWTGQPRGGILWRPADAAILPFSLMWCGFACFWEASVLGLTDFSRRGGAPLIMKLWGLPFVAVGIYMVIGRFFYDAWRRSRTYYGVTQNHILIVERRARLTVTSLPLRNLPPMTRTLCDGDAGSITFGIPAAPTRKEKNGSWGDPPACPTFEFIPDPREVETMIRALHASLADNQQLAM